MKKVLFLLILLSTPFSWGLCQIYNSKSVAVPFAGDAHAWLLSQQTQCPQNVLEYKKIISSMGLFSTPSMVANRGRNNPTLGSFSFFEQVQGNFRQSNQNLQILPGEFFFGHFTQKIANQIELDQEPSRGKLMIELIAWDYKKKLFNFYELIGLGRTSKWFYRGDSQDILFDNQLLYRSSTPRFGKTLRCSGCHSSGGPIMKELSAPHNDWWTQKRPLSFGSAQIGTSIQPWMQNIQDASNFSASVQKGILKLQLSPNYQALKSRQSLQEQLRPLFCETEINIQSSLASTDLRNGSFPVHSSFFLSPFFANSQLNFSKTTYSLFMNKYNLRFPENNQGDADHLWLSPVKGYSDLLALQILLKKKVIDIEFLYDVLAIDAKKSIFSNERCQLLKLIPSLSSANWKNNFIENLKSSSLRSAKILLANLTDPQRNKDWYLKISQDYLQELQAQGLSENLFQKLLTDRQSVFDSEISKNPLGQILEPGFRVIFPVAH